jgi:hypothetical protein
VEKLKMTNLKIKGEYEAYKKKYPRLPSFQEINNEFEIVHVEIEEDAKDYFLRAIRKRMQEKVGYYCHIIEYILYPSGQSPIGMHEANSIDEETKKTIAAVHKKLMFQDRNSMVRNVTNDEEKDVDHIISCYNAMLEVKTDMEKFTESIRDIWIKEIPKEEGSKNYYS